MTGICIKFEEHCCISLRCSLSLVSLSSSGPFTLRWSLRIILPQMYRLYLPFSEPAACATRSLLPLLPVPLFYETPIMPYYFMYHLTFSTLCPFTLGVGGSVSQDYYQVVTTLKANSSIRDRNLISEEFLSAEILRRSRADPRKTWNYMPRDARVLLMAFIQSVNETDGIPWVWCWYIQT